MTDAQTEARAIAQKLQDVVDGTDGWLNVDKAAGIIANALAEKDVEMAKLELERDKWEQHACTGDDVLARTRSRLERAEAQLAEARKALDALDRMNRGLDWCDHDEQARRWSAARRALEGGE